MTPFEEYLYYDSLRPGNPADAVTILKFSGKWEAERFEKALRAVVSRVPLAACCVKEDADGSLRWKKLANLDIRSMIRYFPHSFENSPPPRELLDLRCEPGLRFWVYDDIPHEKVTVLFQFHHAITDAVGSFYFLEELFQHYACGTFPQTPSFSLETMNRWGKVPANRRLVWQMFRQIFHFGIRGWWKQNRQPWELCQKALPTSDEPPPHTLLTHAMVEKTFSRDETTAIRQFARQEGITLNDWLMTCVFQTFHAWNVAESSPRAAKKRLCRLAMPVNLRDGQRQRVALANLVSVVFVDAWLRGKPISLRERLPQVVATIRHAKRRENVQLFLKELQGLHDLRWGRQYRDWGMRWFVNRKEALETAVISNLGILFANKELPTNAEGFLTLGSLRLDDIQLISPRTTNVALTIPVGTYAGRLKIHLCYDPHRIRPQTAQFWLQELTTNLRSPLSAPNSENIRPRLPNVDSSL
ncbi:MAG: hypothetical protein Q4D62_02705 [Planctomycetia bacterium]|nr:hypothetical protein [Planctomycetia bacterium]